MSYAPPSLRLTLRTDLPAGTRVELEITRLFLEQGGQHWYWTMLELAAPVAPLDDGTIGLTLEYSVDELDAKGLASYRSLKRSMGLRMAARVRGDADRAERAGQGTSVRAVQSGLVRPGGQDRPVAALP